MKRYLILPLLFIIVIIGCKSSNNEDALLADSIAGTWNITQVVFKTTTQSDSVVKCSNCFFVFGSSPNSSIQNGSYQLMDAQKVSIQYNAFNKTQAIDVSLFGDTNLIKYIIIGYYTISSKTESSMVLNGDIRFNKNNMTKFIDTKLITAKFILSK